MTLRPAQDDRQVQGQGSAADTANPLPDYSAPMLALFLRARIVARRNIHGEAPAEARHAVSKVIRREARITHAEFDSALAGRPVGPISRGRIWGALGHFPNLSPGEPAAPRDDRGGAQ